MKTDIYEKINCARIGKTLILIVSVLFPFLNVFSQYSSNYQYTLLPPKVINELIGASSGDRAMLHIINLAGYNRPRTDNEFLGYPLETDYLLEKLKEYGLEKKHGVGLRDRYGKSAPEYQKLLTLKIYPPCSLKVLKTQM
jgi:hypothetical protein